MDRMTDCGRILSGESKKGKKCTYSKYLQITKVETDTRKMAQLKNTQFITNQADIQATFPTHELIILSKLHKDWKEIVDFLVIQNFEEV